MLAGLGPDFLSSDSSKFVQVEAGRAGKQPFCCAAHSVSEGRRQRSLTTIGPTPIPAEILLSPQKCLSRVRYKAEIGRTAGNKRPANRVGVEGGETSLQPTVSDKDDHPMTYSSRIALGVSAALVSLSLTLAPSFAEDKMSKGDGMKKEDSMSKDAMKKDDGMMKKDGMKKDNAMSDGMKKDDGMKKN
jgi:pentapeptide MXKDX repeat protein